MYKLYDVYLYIQYSKDFRDEKRRTRYTYLHNKCVILGKSVSINLIKTQIYTKIHQQITFKI